MNQRKKAGIREGKDEEREVEERQETTQGIIRKKKKIQGMDSEMEATRRITEGDTNMNKKMKTDT